MRILKFFRAAVAVSTVLLLPALPVLANSYPAKVQLPAAIMTADCIVIGKVASIEDKTVPAAPFPGARVKVEYRIAVVKIDQDLKGGMRQTHVRIAFQPPQPPPPPPKRVDGPGPIAVIGPRPMPRKDLVPGTEGCFFLKKQGDDTFYRLVDSNWNEYLAKGDRDFDAKVAFVKHALQLVAAPVKGLESKDTPDRLLTACLLLYGYQATGPKMKPEPIDAAQSKRILEAIIAAEWTKPDAQGDEASPRRVFQLLRLTPKDGWNAPKQGFNQDIRVYLKEWDTAAQKWLKDNAASYRIQRLGA